MTSFLSLISLYSYLTKQMATTNITKSKVLINIDSAFEKNGKSCIFSRENHEGKSILGRNGKYYLVFESESEEKKDRGAINRVSTLNVLKCEPRKVTYFKYGPVQSKFEFELNRWTKCFCYIKDGFIEFDCFTKGLEVNLSDTSLQFVIRYKLYSGNSSIGTYNLNVMYKC